MLSKARRGLTQARGRARRQQLLDAARTLLQTHEIDELNLSDVAAKAGIPKSSSYHFYADMADLYAELAASLDAELHEVLLQPIPMKETWEDVLRETVIRAGAYFHENLAGQKLMFGPKTPPDIKRAGRHADIEHSKLVEAQIDRQFVLPDIPDRSRIFFRAVESMDLMFGLSLIEFDHLSDAMIEEAYKISSAYLGVYIPRVLPRRDLAAS